MFSQLFGKRFGSRAQSKQPLCLTSGDTQLFATHTGPPATPPL